MTSTLRSCTIAQEIRLAALDDALAAADQRFGAVPGDRVDEAEGALLRASRLARPNLPAEGDRAALMEHLAAIEIARREAVSPTERLIHAPHPWVAFAIIPLFALAQPPSGRASRAPRRPRTSGRGAQR